MESEPKTYTGVSDKGIPFAIQYTSKGIKWIWGSAARVFSPSPESPAPRPSAPTISASPLGAAAHLVEAMADVGLWWETRQRRHIDAAGFEEDRRIPWTMDMMERWVSAHRDGEHFDLQVSNFLARETNATMQALVDNKKMALPQSMLYDLELMRQMLGSVRQILLVQFEEIHASSFDMGLRLNMEFVRRLGEDPADEWMKFVRDKSSENFSDKLKNLVEDKELFLGELFDDRLPEIPSVVSKSAISRLATRLADFADMAGTAIEPLRSSSMARRNEYRELALFSAEVLRASALHSAWGVVDDVLRSRYGINLVAVEVDDHLTLRSIDDPLVAISSFHNEQIMLTDG